MGHKVRRKVSYVDIGKNKKGEMGEKGEKSGLVTEIAALFRANIYF